MNTTARIMLVDDEPDIRNIVRIVLTKAGYEVTEAATASGLRAALGGPAPDVVLLDLNMPDSSIDNTLKLIPELKRHWPESVVIVLTGFGSIQLAVEATKLGAYYFQTKPFEANVIRLQVERALEYKRMTEANSALRDVVSTMSGEGAPVFRSAVMKGAVRTLERVAPTDMSLLFVGESGVGKEVMADLVHTMSPRNKMPFVKVNCATLPHERIDSELFGCVAGVYPEEPKGHLGLFRQAGGGTLLLDELCDSSPEVQGKLVRVLEEMIIRPVGGRESYRVVCRVLGTTNRSPTEAIQSGKLREDLYYRINGLTIQIPPLRDRREDILPLAEAFLRRYAAQASRTFNGFNAAAIEALKDYDWPGNVRQLQNVIQSAVLLAEGQEITAEDLNFSARQKGGKPSGQNLTLLQAMERKTIVQMLKETEGNKLKAASRLGIGRQTLYNKIKLYRVEA